MTSLFVPDFNAQKVSDLIANALLIQIYMIELLLPLHIEYTRVYWTSIAPCIRTDLFLIPPQLCVHITTDTHGCNFEKISALSAKFIQFIIKNDLLNKRRQPGACITRPKKLA